MRSKNILKHDKSMIFVWLFLIILTGAWNLRSCTRIASWVNFLSSSALVNLALWYQESKMGRWGDCQSRNKACKMVRPANHQSHQLYLFSLAWRMEGWWFRSVPINPGRPESAEGTDSSNFWKTLVDSANRKLFLQGSKMKKNITAVDFWLGSTNYCSHCSLWGPSWIPCCIRGVYLPWCPQGIAACRSALFVCFILSTWNLKVVIVVA